MLLIKVVQLIRMKKCLSHLTMDPRTMSDLPIAQMWDRNNTGHKLIETFDWNFICKTMTLY